MGNNFEEQCLIAGAIYTWDPFFKLTDSSQIMIQKCWLSQNTNKMVLKMNLVPSFVYTSMEVQLIKEVVDNRIKFLVVEPEQYSVLTIQQEFILASFFRISSWCHSYLFEHSIWYYLVSVDLSSSFALSSEQCNLILLLCKLGIGWIKWVCV